MKDTPATFTVSLPQAWISLASYGCIVCDGRVRLRAHGTVGPFLARRIWDKRPFPADLMECQRCGLIFWEPRLYVSEEAKLYVGYRGPEYQRMRHESEAWYTEAFNATLEAPGLYEMRRQALRKVLQPHLKGRTIKQVLDYGGAQGQLAAGLVPGAEAYVYDISGFQPAPGVQAGLCQPNLTICSNVLEHIGLPRVFVREVVKNTGGGLLFFEVPDESPFGAWRFIRHAANLAIMAATRPSLIPSVLRWRGLYMMHEHVSFFTEQALVTLMEEVGCVVLAHGKYGGISYQWPVGRVRMLWVLAEFK